MNMALRTAGLAFLSHKQMLLAFLLAIGIYCSGCVTHHAITPGSEYPTDYSVGALYRIKQDLVAETSGDATLFSWKDTFFVPPPGAFPTVSDIPSLSKREAWKYAVIRAGTLIRIERFDLERNPENGDTVWIYGRIVGGPLTDLELNVSFISRTAGRSSLNVDLYLVDTNFLECIKDK